MQTLTYQVLTNLNCNLDCSYCYERKNNKVNNIDSIKKYLDLMFDRDKDSGVCSRFIELIGGESLMYPALVDQICDYAKELAAKHKVCLSVGISTNGTLLGRPEVQAVIEKHKGLLQVGVSIDGTQEQHDERRYFAGSGKGSYAEIVKHLDWLRATLKTAPGVKATFTLSDFKDHYAEAIIHLIELGFTEIGGNIIYEDICTLEDGAEIAEQLMRLADYMIDNGLLDKVKVQQLNREIDLSVYAVSTFIKPTDDCNFCGSCVHMTCLGFDELLYGCNRFCTMGLPSMSIGSIATGEIVIDNQELVDQVSTQYSKWPSECRSCELRHFCPSCAAAPYETPEGVQAYLNEKRQCGFTHAQAVARMYLGEYVQTHQTQRPKAPAHHCGSCGGKE